MNLSTRLNHPTVCYLVAFDIVSSSQNLANPNGLARDRDLLFDAIDQTTLVREMNQSIVGQFLGDEFRLAIPAVHKGTSVQPSQIVEFIDEVFQKLNSPNLGYAPVIRAAVTQGTIRSLELKSFCYLFGQSALSELSSLYKAVDGVGNLLISKSQLPGLREDSVNRDGYYVKRYTDRPTPKPYPGSASHDLPGYFLVALTNELRDVDESLLGFVRLCLEGFNPIRITISPSSIVFVFQEAHFKESKRFLVNVREKAFVHGNALRLAAAIAYGPGRVIEEKNWLAQTFESGKAIQLCRLLAKLPPGSLAMPDDPEYTELFSPLSQSLNEQLSLRGKRQEVFRCRIDRDYFPKEDRPDSDRQPPAPLQPPEARKQPVVHQNTVIIHEETDSPGPQIKPLTDQDGKSLERTKPNRLDPQSDRPGTSSLKDGTSRGGCVTAIEFTLDGPLHEFDELAFKLALEQATGIKARKIRIASIRSGSTIVRVEGDSNVLNQILQTVLESREILHQFASSTGLRRLEWSIDGSIYHLDVRNGDTLISPGIVEIDDLIDQCEKTFIDDQWDDLFDQIDAFFLRDGNVAKRYRNDIVVFKHDYSKNQKSRRQNTFTDEQYSVAQKRLWDRIRDMLSSLKRDLHDLTGSFSRNTVSRPPFPIDVPDGPQNSGSGMTCPPPADSDISTQIPDGSITHPNTNDFFRKQVVNLLDGNKELTTILYNELFDRNKESNGIDIADYLISTNSTSTDEFPLRRFKRVLGSLVDKRTEINKDCSETLSLMTEILEIASFPTEDNQQIEKVMQEILNSNLGFSNSSKLTTSKPEVAKKLLIASRFKLLSAEFSNLNVAQLFSKDMTDHKDFLRFSRKIHVVTEPALKPDALTLIEFYSKACIDYLGYPHEGSQYQDDLQDILNEKAKDGEIISLLISDEKTEAIKQLRDRFPLLHVVELPRESISRYRAIDRDRMDIDSYLNVLRLP